MVSTRKDGPTCTTYAHMMHVILSSTSTTVLHLNKNGKWSTYIERLKKQSAHITLGDSFDISKIKTAIQEKIALSNNSTYRLNKNLICYTMVFSSSSPADVIGGFAFKSLSRNSVSIMAMKPSLYILTLPLATPPLTAYATFFFDVARDLGACLCF